MRSICCDKCGKELSALTVCDLSIEYPLLRQMSMNFDLCEDCAKEVAEFIELAPKTESIVEPDVDISKEV